MIGYVRNMGLNVRHNSFIQNEIDNEFYFF